jgi:hypothetical protein
MRAPENVSASSGVTGALGAIQFLRLRGGRRGGGKRSRPLSYFALVATHGPGWVAGPQPGP